METNLKSFGVDPDELLEGMYRKENLLLVVEYLLQGNTIREASREFQLSKVTVTKLKDRLSEKVAIYCKCGELSDHRGWCSYRLKKSPARQEFLKRINPNYHGEEMAAPCVGCENEMSSKNIPECIDCDKRIEYADGIEKMEVPSISIKKLERKELIKERHQILKSRKAEVAISDEPFNKLVIDFEDYPQLLEKLSKESHENFRSPQHQLLFLLSDEKKGGSYQNELFKNLFLASKKLIGVADIILSQLDESSEFYKEFEESIECMYDLVFQIKDFLDV